MGIASRSAAFTRYVRQAYIAPIVADRGELRRWSRLLTVRHVMQIVAAPRHRRSRPQRADD